MLYVGASLLRAVIDGAVPHIEDATGTSYCGNGDVSDMIRV